MCFHYALSAKAQTLKNRYDFAIDNVLQFKPRYYANGFSLPQMPVVYHGKMQFMNWGIIPKWIKNDEKASELRLNTLNAKSETIFDKPSFKYSIASDRCLIPATGFFEWKKVGKKKFPHYIHLKDQEIFSFGGIVSNWINDSGEAISTYSIITVPANELMTDIHNTKFRMPLIFDKETEYNWLDDLSEDQIIELMKPLDNKKMDAWPIGPLITEREAEVNVPEVYRPFFYSELQKGLF